MKGFKHSNGVWVCLLIVAGLLARIYSAYYFSTSLNPDMGVNALMTKHIAEGKTLPIFFYGQAYLGSLTTYVSVIPYRFLGHSMFSVLLGVAAVSFLSLIVFWLWARDLFGPRTGLYSTGLMIFGSYSFLYYNIFYGYPIALLTGLLACWCTTRLIRNAHEKPIRNLIGWTLGLGFAAGLGWWSNQLSLAYFAACGVVLLVCVPLWKLLCLALIALPAALIGAAPWILYTLGNADSLDILNQTSSAKTGWGGMILTYLGLLSGLIDGAKASGLPGMIAATLMILLLMLGIWGIRKERFDETKIARRARWLFPLTILVANFALCMASGRFWHVPAVRYLLPSAPALFLLSGAGLAILSRGKKGWLAPLLLVVVLILQGMNVPSVFDANWKAQVESSRADIDLLSEFAEKEGIEVFRGDWMLYGLNFASEERVRLSSYPVYDRYRPYRAVAAVSEEVAVLNNYKQFTEFLRRSGAQSDFEILGRYRVHHHIAFPQEGEELLTLKDMTLSVPALMDGNLDTPVEQGERAVRNPENGEPLVVEVNFETPQHLTRLIAHGATGQRVHLLNVAAVLASGKNKEFYNRQTGDVWFESEGGFYPAGLLEHEAVRLDSSVAVQSLQIRVPITIDGRSRVSEVLLYRSSEEVPTMNRLNLEAELESYNPDKVYAPRRISEKLHQSSLSYKTIIPDGYYESYDGYDLHENLLPEIDFLERVALVVGSQDADRNRNLFKETDLVWREQAKDGWVIFAFDPVEVPRPVSLIWTEQGAFFRSSELALMRRAEFYFEEGRSAMDEGAMDVASVLFEKALEIRPDHPGARQGLQAFDPEKVSVLPVDVLNPVIRFGKNIEFLGLEIEPTTVGEGSSVSVRYFWRCRPGTDPNQYAVFVHIENKDGRFQDDHVLLEPVSETVIQGQSFPALFDVSRTWTLPADLPEGEYKIYLGVYERNSGKRLKARTELPENDGRVELEQRFRTAVGTTTLR